MNQIIIKLTNVSSKVDSVVTIQKARPDHSSKLVEWIYETNPLLNKLLYRNRQTAIRIFAEIWKRSEGLLSHKNARVLFFNKELVGVEIGINSDAKSHAISTQLNTISGLMPTEHFRQLKNNLLYINHNSPMLPNDAYYLDTLAVAFKYRGKKLGSSLLEVALDNASTNGLTSVHLDIYATNRAIALYQRFGFKILAESRFPDLTKYGLPSSYSMLRMVKAL